MLSVVWRWFWRIVLWGTLAIIALIALLALADWGQTDRIGWALMFFGGLGGAALHFLSEIKRGVFILVEQNARLLNRQPHSFD